LSLFFSNVMQSSSSCVTLVLPQTPYVRRGFQFVLRLAFPRRLLYGGSSPAF
jgi:hypothetical protein